MSDQNQDNPGIFAPVIGHSGAKAVLRAALRAGDVHVLLHGPPASGKSVALTAIEDAVPNAQYEDAAGFSERQLRDVLAEDPPILCLDEFDAMRTDAYVALTTAMEQGRVTKQVRGDSFDVEIRTQVVAACNDLGALPGHIQDRFRTVTFDEYGPDEFVRVCGRLLPESVDWVTDEGVGEQIGACIHEVTGTTSARDARDVAKLAGDMDRVPQMARALMNADEPVDSAPIAPDDIAVSGTSPEEVSFEDWVMKACPHRPAERTEAFQRGEYLCSTCAGKLDAPRTTPYPEATGRADEDGGPFG